MTARNRPQKQPANDFHCVKKTARNGLQKQPANEFQTQPKNGGCVGLAKNDAWCDSLREKRYCLLLGAYR